MTDKEEGRVTHDWNAPLRIPEFDEFERRKDNHKVPRHRNPPPPPEDRILREGGMPPNPFEHETIRVPPLMVKYVSAGTVISIVMLVALAGGFIVMIIASLISLCA